MKRFFLWLLAILHASDYAVCEMSKGRGAFDDYHDYMDDECGEPWHFVPMRCRRCGKQFYI